MLRSKRSCNMECRYHKSFKSRLESEKTTTTYTVINIKRINIITI